MHITSIVGNYILEKTFWDINFGLLGFHRRVPLMKFIVMGLKNSSHHALPKVQILIIDNWPFLYFKGRKKALRKGHGDRVKWGVIRGIGGRQNLRSWAHLHEIREAWFMEKKWEKAQCVRMLSTRMVYEWVESGNLENHFSFLLEGEKEKNISYTECPVYVHLFRFSSLWASISFPTFIMTLVEMG